MNRKKEVAKFFAGAVAWEAVGHVMLAFSGLLPMKIWGITVSPVANAVWIVIAAAGAILLAWYAWAKSERRDQAMDLGGQNARLGVERLSGHAR